MVHGGGLQHGARELTRGARSALIIWTKRACTFENFRHVPDDVQRKHLLPYWSWRDQVAFATATTRSRVVAPLWAARRVHMDRALDMEHLGGVLAQEKIDTIRSIITHSAPPGRDAIAGTIATLVAVSEAALSSVTPEWRKTAKQHEFVFAALDSLLRDVVVMVSRPALEHLWFGRGLVKVSVPAILQRGAFDGLHARRRSAATGSVSRGPRRPPEHIERRPPSTSAAPCARRNSATSALPWATAYLSAVTPLLSCSSTSAPACNNRAAIFVSRVAQAAQNGPQRRGPRSSAKAPAASSFSTAASLPPTAAA